MTCLQGETFEVSVDQETTTASFKGALRLSGTEDYTPVLNMLRHMINARSADRITVDLRNLEFLNSSGITMLSRFVIEVRDQGGIVLQFRASGSIAWHARSLTNLQRLMPSLQIEMA